MSPFKYLLLRLFSRKRSKPQVRPITRDDLRRIVRETRVVLPQRTEHMSSDNIVDIAKGLLAAATDGLSKPPYRVTVPAGTNLGEYEEGENVTLLQRLKDLSPDVNQVVVGKGRGVSIESVGAEDDVKKAGGY